MSEPKTTFDVARFRDLQRALDGASLGESLSVVAQTGSTNDDALEAARLGAPHGATYVADTQTRGRGRRGHTWISPAGENLTFSVLLRPKIPAGQVSTLTLVVGLAVRAVVARRVTARVAVKWPNDVVIGRTKIAGILVESRLSGSSVEAVVVGVGLNVHMENVPSEIAAVATSLALAGDPAPNREAALAELLLELGTRLTAFEHDGLSQFLPELAAHDALLGERVGVGNTRGIGAGIDAEGALLVRTEDGAVHAVTSGTVERI
jgi:BirA family biotin operon repressor/biotin-[acetyl-CoA-carboxylase] ligase